ncbi:MAG: cytochrome c-type biogenesis protein CcmH [Alphaproteobacteria bacterium]|nr:cytochrome c-type biogenesis protein CcmH [Alphaproteobacteria bacterium]
MKALILAAALVAPLGDPQDEARARALENEIRCVVCQNEPISQSTADMATDMRRLVRERIAAGESDSDIRAFFRDRYGDFVLLRPGADPAFWGLWAAPFILLAIGLGALLALRRGKDPLSPEPDER